MVGRAMMRVLVNIERRANTSGDVKIDVDI
jgi:hypothetical protein